MVYLVVCEDYEQVQFFFDLYVDYSLLEGCNFGGASRLLDLNPYSNIITYDNGLVIFVTEEYAHVYTDRMEPGMYKVYSSDDILTVDEEVLF